MNPTPVQEPKKQDEEPRLSVVPNQSSASAKPQQPLFKGGGGGGSLIKDASALWIICAFGSILVGLSLLALSNDPNTGTYHMPGLGLAGQLRVWCELMVLIIGSGCMFTSLVCLRARAQAAQIEEKSGGSVKSLRAKKLDHVSNDTIIETICSYVAALFGQAS
jgi:hypothetical protein